MTDFFAAAQRVISMIMTGTELLFAGWLANGGIIYLLRGISFWIDCTLVNCIGAIYGYFMTLLEGTMFNKAIVDAVMKNVYIFIGVFVFFRIAMLLIKYMINPELIADQKVGTDALIKRVIIGVLGIIFIPTIFNYSMKLQTAIIKDQLIQQLFIPRDMLKKVGDKVTDGGKGIGTTILSGFINPSSKASQKIKNEYKKALEQNDLSSIDFNSGGFLGMGYTSYNYSYFYLVSTFILGYVLYLMLKYCLDIVVRFFKLFLFQLIAPIAMVEYMANGADDGVFKNWKNAVLGSYFMLFTRIMSIWFVLFVMTLMNGQFPTYSGDSLLAKNDYLLKALIMIGLLAFMMDLPKILGNMLGLDLEQESSATGLLKSVGGIIKGVGMGALAAGGAALGGAAGALGGVQKAGFSNVINNMKAAHGLRKDNKGMSRQDAKQAIRKNGTFQANSVAALKQSTTAAKGALKSTPRAIGAALVGSTSVGQAIQKGYRDTASGIDKEKNKAKQEDASKEEAEFRQHQISVTDQINASTTVIADQGKRANIKLDDLIDNTDQTLTQTINIDRKLGKVSGNVDTIAKNTETTAQQTVNIDRKLGTVSGNVEAIAKNTETTAQQTVNIDRKLGKVSGDVDTIATNTKNTVQRTVDIDQKNDSLL